MTKLHLNSSEENGTFLCGRNTYNCTGVNAELFNEIDSNVICKTCLRIKKEKECEP